MDIHDASFFFQQNSDQIPILDLTFPTANRAYFVYWRWQRHRVNEKQGKLS